MHHAAVVTGLVARHRSFLVDDGDLGVRAATPDLPGGGQPDDPGADDDEPLGAQRSPTPRRPVAAGALPGRSLGHMSPSVTASPGRPAASQAPWPILERCSPPPSPECRWLPGGGPAGGAGPAGGGLCRRLAGSGRLQRAAEQHRSGGGGRAPARGRSDLPAGARGPGAAPGAPRRPGVVRRLGGSGRGRAPAPTGRTAGSPWPPP